MLILGRRTPAFDRDGKLQAEFDQYDAECFYCFVNEILARPPLPVQVPRISFPLSLIVNSVVARAPP